ncbi:MAG: FAD-binding domain-containing protein [Actinomycetota bacterium]
MPDLPLPVPDAERPAILDWVEAHLGMLCCDPVAPSRSFVGGQSAADGALAALDIADYASARNEVHPVAARGASRLSPYIRHGLLPLPDVWDRVAEAPSYDRFRYQGELLWQDYARHWYALHGSATREAIAYEPAQSTASWDPDPWWRSMACIDRTLTELETDGWCVNQTRMWLASQYTVRGHGRWRDGEDHLFTHLLDGSRAANRLGWQWTIGGTRPKAHGFARPQVTKRAPAFCQECALRDRCPIAGYARSVEQRKRERPPVLDPATAYGPVEAPTAGTGSGAADPEAVWLTAESLGHADPALSAHPELPVWFVFDRALLHRLQLSSKRLVFLTETLAELAQTRTVHLWLGDPVTVIGATPVAVTFAPVPGFRQRVARLTDPTLHPWPWLRPPTEELLARLAITGRAPSFREFCRVTKP